MVCIAVWPTFPGNLSQDSVTRASTITLSCRDAPSVAAQLRFSCLEAAILHTHRVWTSGLACGTPAPRPRQAGSTPGHHAFSFMGPGLAPQVCLRGSREVHLYPKQLPGLAGQSNKQPL